MTYRLVTLFSYLSCSRRASSFSALKEYNLELLICSGLPSFLSFALFLRIFDFCSDEAIGTFSNRGLSSLSQSYNFSNLWSDL